MITIRDLQQDLEAMGIRPSDTVCIHTSLRSVGRGGGFYPGFYGLSAGRAAGGADAYLGQCAS